MTDTGAKTLHGAVLMLAAILPTMAIVSLVPVLPLLLQEFSGVEGSEFLVPIAMTIPALCVALFSPVAGWLSDKLGRKPVLLVSFLIYGALGVLPFVLSDLFHIIFARIGLGIAEAAIMTVATAMIGDYFHGERRERWVATQVAVSSLSAIALIAIGGALGEILGSRGPFLLYLLAFPIALVAALVLFEPDHVHHDAAEAGGFKLTAILPLLLTTLGIAILFYTTIVNLGPFLALTSEVTPAVIGIAGAAVNVGVAIGSVVFGRVKVASGQLLLGLGLCCMGLGYLGAGVSSGVVPVTLFAVLICLGAGLLLPTLLTWILKLLPPAARGRGTGMWTGMFFLGQFIAPILASAIATNAGGLGSVLYIYAGIALVLMLAAAIAARNAPPLKASAN
ncbi:MFS transporter [Ponticaulis sp.]|uniref:MFS transporter n=1 Tax=Ponticaulis sp. TaxID=2020902 RepID=UPI00261A8660|nr:MFS transporter [Ponticaulis sp.]MDF1679051.1 MFS transporter [Ponticaulis sp.]